jgi:prepilin-type processing-associated H-X9-DG protein
MSKALLLRETSSKDFPGYINRLGIKGTDKVVRAPWVVMTFPQIEQVQLYDSWAAGNPGMRPAIAILVCPSNPSETITRPTLSYVANAGFRGENLDERNTTDYHRDYENPANGVFFDKTRIRELQGITARDRPPTAPADIITMTINYIQAKGDGTTKTMLLTESLAAMDWCYAESDYIGTEDRNYHFGATWVQLSEIGADPRLRMNGKKDQRGYETWAEVESGDLLTGDGSVNDINPRPGIASSNHSGGVNAAFVDGHVVFLNDQMDPFVNAQLMTSNHKRSDLIFNTSGPIYEINQPEPADGSF